MKPLRKLRAGDWVEIRSKEEILSSLDKNGRLEGLPFMPQMLDYCGKRFKIFKRAHKTCDTVNPVAGRRVPNAVHLNLRCDGKAYGGCQAACLIFWKEAWLKPVNEGSTGGDTLNAGPPTKLARCSEDDVRNATSNQDRQRTDEMRYICQATQLPYYTMPLSWWDIRQYIEDYTSGNTSLEQMFRGFVYMAYFHGAQTWRTKIGRISRWFYDFVQSLWGGIPYPRKTGTIPAGQLTPACDLELRPGELVRVKSHSDILSTLDVNSMNRGLAFDAELVPYCGGTYRVKTRVATFIDEKTGKLKTLKTPALILEGVYCQSRYSHQRLFCPRSIYGWWREVWLERVSESTDLSRHF